MLQTIPLNQLEPSPRNVRKHVGSGFADLVASIASQGLLQGLVVSKPAANGGPYLVEAGGRRLSALRALVSKGSIPGDYPVPCRVVGVEESGEAGLAENFVRQAMHPADEFDAFKALADAGQTSDEIAERFGCEPKHVEQRLRLANVAPEILAHYRNGKANLEQMQALSLTSDHKTQVAAWKSTAQQPSHRRADYLRAAIVAKDIDSDDTLAIYVGEKAYEAAGGVVRRDLFGDEIYFPDGKLLERLAEEKLQKTVAKVMKEGWKWGETRLDFDWSESQKFGRAPNEGKKDQFSEAIRATAGFIVHIDGRGQGVVMRGLIRPEDRTDAVKAAGNKEVLGGKSAKPTKKPGELTFAGTQRLQAEASAIARSALVAEPQRALALLVAELGSAWMGRKRSVVNNYSGHPSWVHIQREHSGRVHGPVSDAIDASPFAAKYLEIGTKYELVLSAKGLDPVAWALEQSTETLLELLAYLTARETEAVDIYPHSASTRPAGLVEAAGVDLAGTWKPTKEWLAGLPRTTVTAMVAEANGRKGKDLAAPLAKLKGEALAAAALPLLPDRWLPLALRAPKQRAKLDGKQRAAGEGNADE